MITSESGTTEDSFFWVWNERRKGTTEPSIRYVGPKVEMTRITFEIEYIYYK